jgi:hypothetical protein
VVRFGSDSVRQTKDMRRLLAVPFAALLAWALLGCADADGQPGPDTPGTSAFTEPPMEDILPDEDGESPTPGETP